jgi:predicted amidophosphoribosyltransferase
MPSLPLLRPATSALLDLLLPGACAGCGDPGPPLCAACRLDLVEQACLWRPSPPPEGLPPCARAVPYDGVARSALIAFKEHGRADLAGPLGVALASAVSVVLGGARLPVALVPVPASPAALRRRGRDHVAQLARAASRQLRARGTPARVLPLLRATRTPADQSGLDAERRASNVRQAFAARSRCTSTGGDLVILVDDIVTTGSTAAECATTLAAAGCRVDGMAAVAAAVLRRPARLDSGPERGTLGEEVVATPSVVSRGIA